jgi:hypothetical protein
MIMDCTIEEYLAFEQSLLEQAEKDGFDLFQEPEEEPVDDTAYWC